MTLHAVQDVTDAFAVARTFLLPVEVGRWLKLALVVLFIGGGSRLPTTQFDASGVPRETPPAGIPFDLPADVLPLIVTFVVVAVLLALVFGLIGAIMEFIFIESLRSREVSIRQYWGARWRQGLRLFGFRVAISLPVLAVFLGWAALLFLGGVSIISVGVLLLGVPFLLIVGLVYGVVTTFTTHFVVPIMIEADTGVLAGWGLLWDSITVDWKQYLAYAVVAFVLSLVTGVLASVALGFAALVALIPIGGLAGITYLTVSFSSFLGIAILVVLGLSFVALMIVLWALVKVPIQAFLRYYALLVLGDIEASFDLIPQQRSAVRE